MAITLSSTPVASHRHELTPNRALRHAWYWYLSLLFVPFLLFLAVMTIQADRPKTALAHGSPMAWFIAATAFMLIAAPIAFTIRSRLFRSYWRGEGVNPRAYLKGMLVVWLTFEIGGIISLVGWLMSDSILPCMISGLTAFMFFTPFWPNGRAMAHPTGNTDDPEIYQEPR